MSADYILIVIAIVCFIVAGLPQPQGSRFNFMCFGFAALAATLIV